MAGGSIIGSVLGAVIGGVIGWALGPAGSMTGIYIGASFGASLGGAVGAMVDPIRPDAVSPGQPQGSNLSVTMCQEGSPVNEMLGTQIFPGNIIDFDPASNRKTVRQQVWNTDYWLSFVLGLVMGPVDTLYTIYREENIVWDGQVNDPGDGSPATIFLTGLGKMRFYFGNQLQNADPWWVTFRGATATPAYRGFCYAVFEDGFLGDFNRVPVIKFVCRKAPGALIYNPTTDLDENLNHAKRIIGWATLEINRLDYNPAHAIAYILHEWAGVPTNKLNYDKFMEVSEALYVESPGSAMREGIGIDMLLSTQEFVLTWLDEICRHIDGGIRFDSDGTIYPFLVREQSLATLPEITDDMVIEPPVLTRKSWLATVNEIKVQYPRRCVEGGEEAITQDNWMIVVVVGEYGIGDDGGDVIQIWIYESNTGAWRNLSPETPLHKTGTAIEDAVSSSGNDYDRRITLRIDDIGRYWIQYSIHDYVSLDFAMIAYDGNDGTWTLGTWNQFDFAATGYDWYEGAVQQDSNDNGVGAMVGLLLDASSTITGYSLYALITQDYGLTYTLRKVALDALATVGVTHAVYVHHDGVIYVLAIAEVASGDWIDQIVKLYKSDDYGATWSTVATFDTDENSDPCVAAPGTTWRPTRGGGVPYKIRVFDTKPGTFGGTGTGIVVSFDQYLAPTGEDVKPRLLWSVNSGVDWIWNNMDAPSIIVQDGAVPGYTLARKDGMCGWDLCYFTDEPSGTYSKGNLVSIYWGGWYGEGGTYGDDFFMLQMNLFPDSNDGAIIPLKQGWNYWILGSTEESGTPNTQGMSGWAGHCQGSYVAGVWTTTQNWWMYSKYAQIDVRCGIRRGDTVLVRSSSDGFGISQNDEIYGMLLKSQGGPWQFMAFPRQDADYWSSHDIRERPKA